MSTSECPADFPITICPPGVAKGAYPEEEKPKKVHPVFCGPPFSTRREHLLEDEEISYES